MAPRKTASKAEGTPKKPSTRKTAKYIRNLRGTHIHLRLGNPKDPYRIEMSWRGTAGDIAVVPAELTGDGTFLQGIDLLYEVITKTEADEIQAAQRGGYQARPTAEVYRDEDTVIRTEDDFKSTGKYDQQPARRSAGPNIVGNVVGSDAAVAAGYEAAQKGEESPVLPEGVKFDRKVSIERVKGQ